MRARVRELHRLSEALHRMFRETSDVEGLEA